MTEEPGVLQSMGSQRVGHDLVTEQQQLFEGWLLRLRLSIVRSLRLTGLWKMRIGSKSAQSESNSNVYGLTSEAFQVPSNITRPLLSLLPPGASHSPPRTVAYFFTGEQCFENSKAMPMSLIKLNSLLVNIYTLCLNRQTTERVLTEKRWFLLFEN